MKHFCRHCGSTLENDVLDLGHQPPSNAYLTKPQLDQPEVNFPLKVYVCSNCWLMQLPAHATADQLFTSDYAYFSSTSTSWCAHAKLFVENAVRRLNLTDKSNVIELASNDGYLLKYLHEKGIPCLGIEPTHATALVSKEKGINTIEKFFTYDLAQQLPKADLVIANNVLAHVPDINDFMAGISYVLKDGGFASIEFPHLASLIDNTQFDTIYHEHYSYLSLSFMRRLASSVDLKVVDVEQLSTHGGSVRVWLSKSVHSVQNSNTDADKFEYSLNLNSLHTYKSFQDRSEGIKRQFVRFLLDQYDNKKLVLGYGAAAKGNTLLNFAGVKSDLLSGIADKALSKQGKYTPGSHIPIIKPEVIDQLNPHYILLLPWNLRAEISELLPSYPIVTAIPTLNIINE